MNSNQKNPKIHSRKTTILLIVITIIFTLSFQSFSSVVTQNVEVSFDSIKVIVNGKNVDAPNILYDGRTYVQLRTISEMLDKNVAWNESTRTAEITNIIPSTKEIELINGNYESGKDFSEGTYDIVAVKGAGSVSSSNIFDGGINAMMGISDMEIYQKEYKNIKLPKGTTIKIDAVTVKLILKE